MGRCRFRFSDCRGRRLGLVLVLLMTGLSVCRPAAAEDEQTVGSPPSVPCCWGNWEGASVADPWLG